jgi:arylsulfatase A-like enzyme
VPCVDLSSTMDVIRICRQFGRALSPEADGFIASALAFTAAFGIWRSSGCAAGPTAEEAFPDASTPALADSSEPVSPSSTIQEAATGPFNVILITVDTLRWDLGFAGYPRPVSPNLDALARRSVVYDRAYATASYTMMCLAPLLIGRYASETARDYQHYTTFFPSNVFVAERVKEAGGHTLAATTHHYFRSGRKGFEQGFDVWDTSAIPVTSLDNETAVTSGHLSTAAIALLDRSRSKGRFFAWFHYLDPHSPYVPHEGAPNFAAMTDPRLRIPAERAPYDGEVWFTDKQIGRVLAHVARQPWANETAIILTADHGEAFGEHGHWKHGRELWEPLVRVPLLVYVPGTTPRRIDVKRSHIDLVPTVLELMGIAAGERTALRGKSLLADIQAAKAGRALEERDVYMDMPEGQLTAARRAIVTGRSPGLKLIDLGTGVGPARYALYDLERDPAETNNLAAGDSIRLGNALAVLQRLRANLQELPATR